MSNRYTGSNRQIWCHRFGVTHFYIVWILIAIHEVTGETTGTCPAGSLTSTTPDRVPGPRPHLIQTSEEGCFGNPQNGIVLQPPPHLGGQTPPPAFEPRRGCSSGWRLLCKWRHDRAAHRQGPGWQDAEGQVCCPLACHLPPSSSFLLNLSIHSLELINWSLVQINGIIFPDVLDVPH